MASWWKLIAQQQNAMNASAGPYPKRVATQLGAANMNGLTWEAKLVSRKSFGGRGAWSRRLVNYGAAVAQTAYGTAGAYGRSIYNQNNIGVAVPAGAHSVTVPVGGLGVHGV